MEFYTKEVSLKGRISYVKYEPQISDRDISEREALTLCGALGITILNNYMRLIPRSKQNLTNIKTVEKSLINLLKGMGKPVSDEMSNYAMDCWNLAMMIMSKGAK